MVLRLLKTRVAYFELLVVLPIPVVRHHAVLPVTRGNLHSVERVLPYPEATHRAVKKKAQIKRSSHKSRRWYMVIGKHHDTYIGILPAVNAA